MPEPYHGLRGVRTNFPRVLGATREVAVTRRVVASGLLGVVVVGVRVNARPPRGMGVGVVMGVAGRGPQAAQKLLRGLADEADEEDEGEGEGCGSAGGGAGRGVDEVQEQGGGEGGEDEGEARGSGARGGGGGAGEDEGQGGAGGQAEGDEQGGEGWERGREGVDGDGEGGEEEQLEAKREARGGPG
jgi:hypothetical protein